MMAVEDAVVVRFPDGTIDGNNSYIMIQDQRSGYGAGFYEGAIVTFILAVLTVTVIHKVEYTLNKRNRRFGMYVEIRSDKFVRQAITALGERYKITDVQVTSPRSGISGNVGIEANIHNNDLSTNPGEVSKILEELDFVVFALESI